MKRIALILLTLLMCFSVWACESDKENHDKDDENISKNISSQTSDSSDVSTETSFGNESQNDGETSDGKPETSNSDDASNDDSDDNSDDNTSDDNSNGDENDDENDGGNGDGNDGGNDGGNDDDDNTDNNEYNYFSDIFFRLNFGRDWEPVKALQENGIQTEFAYYVNDTFPVHKVIGVSSVKQVQDMVEAHYLEICAPYYWHSQRNAILNTVAEFCFEEDGNFYYVFPAKSGTNYFTVTDVSENTEDGSCVVTFLHSLSETEYSAEFLFLDGKYKYRELA